MILFGTPASAWTKVVSQCLFGGQRLSLGGVCRIDWTNRSGNVGTPLYTLTEVVPCCLFGGEGVALAVVCRKLLTLLSGNFGTQPLCPVTTLWSCVMGSFSCAKQSIPVIPACRALC